MVITVLQPPRKPPPPPTTTRHHHLRNLINFPTLLKDSPSRLTQLASCERLMDEPPGPLTLPWLGSLGVGMKSSVLQTCVRAGGCFSEALTAGRTKLLQASWKPFHASLFLIFPSALHSSCGSDGTTDFINPIVIISAFTIRCFEAFLLLRRCPACLLPPSAVF